jgi:hypothetical protein
MISQIKRILACCVENHMNNEITNILPLAQQQNGQRVGADLSNIRCVDVEE